MGAVAQGGGGIAGWVVATVVVVVATVVVVVDVLVEVGDWETLPQPTAVTARETSAMSLRVAYPFHSQDREKSLRRAVSPHDTTCVALHGFPLPR
jgi:hypothetical protein